MQQAENNFKCARNATTTAVHVVTRWEKKTKTDGCAGGWEVPVYRAHVQVSGYGGDEEYDTVLKSGDIFFAWIGYLRMICTN